MLLCGVAGAGKTRFARNLQARGWLRLSVDVEVFGRAGAQVADDDPRKAHAQAAVDRRLVRLLADGADVVLDLSLWSRSERDRYKSLVEDHGGRWSLVHLRAPEAELRRRLRNRHDPLDADGVDVPPELLQRYLDGFEVPRGEGETDPWDTPGDARWNPA